MQQALLKQFKAHRAQMRTQYDLDELATLTLQVYERGLDAWSPIVAAAHGDEYHIISGHRRHMAVLLTLALKGWVADNPERDITIEVVRAMLQTLVESLGSLDKLMASLVNKYGAELIDFVPFEGSEKSQILTLQAANYGSAKPDMLGIAHSFHEAVLAGASEPEIARNCGQHPNYVRNHLALTEVPPELAQRIVAGDLPMSVAATIAELPEPKRTGLAIFVLANTAGTITAKEIKEIAATLKKWSGLQQPLLVKHQTQRNIARALVLLLHGAVTNYPQDAYATVAMLIYRGLEKEPWTDDERLLAWFEAFGGETYVTEGQINWKKVTDTLLPSISCQTCPLARLPKDKLQVEIPDLPCRAGQVIERCLNGLAPDDPFEVRVRWDWAGLPGIVHEGRDYKARSMEDLLQAWQAQAEREQEEDEEAASREPLAAGKEEAVSREPLAAGNKTMATTTSPAANSQPPAVSLDSPIPLPFIPLAEEVEECAWLLNWAPLQPGGLYLWDDWMDYSEPIPLLCHLQYQVWARAYAPQELDDDTYQELTLAPELDILGLDDVLNQMVAQGQLTLPPPLDALPWLIGMVTRTTENFWLDCSVEALSDGERVGWDDLDVARLISEWHDARPVLEQVNALLNWVEQETRPRLKMIADLLNQAYEYQEARGLS